jgi:hypothetical protein
MKHYIGANNPMHAQLRSHRVGYHGRAIFRGHAKDGVGTITLNRPERKNPLTFESYAELASSCSMRSKFAQRRCQGRW